MEIDKNNLAWEGSDGRKEKYGDSLMTKKTSRCSWMPAAFKIRSLSLLCSVQTKYGVQSAAYSIDTKERLSRRQSGRSVT